MGNTVCSKTTIDTSLAASKGKGKKGRKNSIVQNNQTLTSHKNHQDIPLSSMQKSERADSNAHEDLAKLEELKAKHLSVQKLQIPAASTSMVKGQLDPLDSQKNEDNNDDDDAGNMLNQLEHVEDDLGSRRQSYSGSEAGRKTFGIGQNEKFIASY